MVCILLLLIVGTLGRPQGDPIVATTTTTTTANDEIVLTTLQQPQGEDVNTKNSTESTTEIASENTTATALQQDATTTEAAVQEDTTAGNVDIVTTVSDDAVDAVDAVTTAAKTAEEVITTAAKTAEAVTTSASDDTTSEDAETTDNSDIGTTTESLAEDFTETVELSASEKSVDETTENTIEDLKETTVNAFEDLSETTVNTVEALEETTVNAAEDQQETTVVYIEEQQETTVVPTEIQQDTTVEPTEEQQDTTVKPTEEQQDTTVEPTEEQQDTTVEPTEEQEETTMVPTEEQQETTVVPTGEQEETTLVLSETNLGSVEEENAEEDIFDLKDVLSSLENKDELVAEIQSEPDSEMNLADILSALEEEAETEEASGDGELDLSGGEELDLSDFQQLPVDLDSEIGVMETAINFLDDLETLAETAEDDLETLETLGDLETLETLGDLNSRVEALGTEESNLGESPEQSTAEEQVAEPISIFAGTLESSSNVQIEVPESDIQTNNIPVEEVVTPQPIRSTRPPITLRIQNQPQSKEVFSPGSVFALQCVATSKVDLDIKYSWTKNGKFLDLATMPNVFLESSNKGNLIIVSPRTEDEGLYQCAAANSEGAVFTRVIKVQSNQRYRSLRRNQPSRRVTGGGRALGLGEPELFVVLPSSNGRFTQQNIMVVHSQVNQAQ